MEENQAPRALEGLRVIELGSSVSVAVAGLVLADNGAEVIGVEPPQGSALRSHPAFAMWARGKRSLVTDHYLQFDARCSKMPVSSIQMTEPRYQLQRQSLAQQCQQADVPFLDLTPLVQAEEAAGHHLYWSYDDHMRGEGYVMLGEAIFEWWGGLAGR